MKYLFKQYVVINITFIFLALYFLNLPFISSVITTYTPIKVTCPFSKLTGKDCPYCGITAQIKELNENSQKHTTGKMDNTSNKINLGYFLYYFVYVEIVFRIIMIIIRKRVCIHIFYIDFAIHSTLLMAFLINNIIYLFRYL